MFAIVPPEQNAP
ncbi:hypothetical protein D030_1361, partial [Vibrio parahaemolyticus AQ3810]